jgi:hypothetical protein
MYMSEKLTHVEFAADRQKTLFRGNCEASLQKSCRYPAVALDQDGRISAGQCNCEANRDGRCSHIACLLFLVEDISVGQVPKIKKACTSKPQAWGRGSHRQLDPGPIAKNRYIAISI